MQSCSTIFSIFWLLAVVHIGSTVASGNNDLKKRSVDLDQSCDQEAFHSKVVASLQDAHVMLQQTQERSFQDSEAYSRYFMAGESQQVIAMFRVMLDVVAQAHIFRRTTNSLHARDSNGTEDTSLVSRSPDIPVKIHCGNSKLTICETDPHVIAVAISMPQSNIVFCDLFLRIQEPELSAKPFNNEEGGWCQPNRPFSSFKGPGASLIHELSHLSQVGQAAGLPFIPYVYSANLPKAYAYVY